MSSCKAIKLCKKIYPTYYTSCDNCQLLLDLKTNYPSKDFLKAIDSDSKIKELIYKLKNTESNFLCPRSKNLELPINKTGCDNNKCPYYNNSFLAKCILIHSSLYFPNRETIPKNIIRNSLNITKNDFNRDLEIGIYLSRILYLLSKFNFFINKHNKTHIEIKNKIFSLCSSCNSFHDFDKKCYCIETPFLMDKRKKFEAKWKELISNDALSKIKKANNLVYIRDSLNKLNVENVSFYNIPFSFLFLGYIHTFNETNELKIVKNLGITLVMLKQAKILYL